MKFDDRTQVGGHRKTEAERKNIRAKFISAMRKENYGGGTIPADELEAALRKVDLWEVRGRI